MKPRVILRYEKQKAKEIIDNDAIVMRNGDRMVDVSTAYMAIELAEQEMEKFCTYWIDPKKMMPEANKNVLVKCSNRKILLDCYVAELDKFRIEVLTRTKVIGWRKIM